MTAPRIEHVDATASSDAIATILERDGCIVIDRLLDDVFCDRILAELEPWMARVPTGGGDWVGKKTRRVHGLVAKSAAVRENVCHPLVLETMDRMLGTVVRRLPAQRLFDNLDRPGREGPGAAPR